MHLLTGPSAQVPAAPDAVPRPALRNEVVVVLALSVLQAAVFAAIDLFSAPIVGEVRSTFAAVPFVDQVARFVFGLAPVALVLVLLQRDRQPLSVIGLGRERPAAAVGWGAAIAGIIGGGGLVLYLLAVQVGLNRMVVPIPPPGYWWTVPVIVLGAIEAGALEEVVVVGYLITRLQQLGWRPWTAVAASALLRGAYHLYQGWGAFVGNLIMGALLGWWFVRTRRLWPLVAAHVIIDVAAGIGYLYLAPRVSWI